MQHSLTGWDIGQFDQTDWIPWDTGTKPEPKSSPSPTASTSLSSKPTPDTEAAPTNTPTPNSSTSSTAPSAPRTEVDAGDAYAASPGSTHDDFTVDTVTTYLLIFEL